MTKPRRLTWVQLLCWPALLLSLAGSLSNLAWAFASVQDGNLLLGYIQAGAVDLGLISLAVGIAARRKAQRPAFWLWFGTGFFGAISLFGNLLHGYAHAQDIAAPYALSVARPVVLAAVLPALVLILSEVIGHDARSVARTAQLGDAQRTETQSDAIPDAIPAQSPDRRQRALAILASGQHNQKEIAAIVGVHPATVSKWKRAEGNDGN